MNDDPDLETADLEPVDVTAEVTGVKAESWPAGWYADAWTAGQYRYWTGQSWTGETRTWGPASDDAGVTHPWPSSTDVASAATAPTTVVPPPQPDATWGATQPRQSRPNGRAIAGVVGLVVLTVVAGVVGYAIDSSTHHSNSSAPPVALPTTPGSQPSTGTPGTSGPTSTDPDRGVLGRLVVRQGDVGPTRPVVLEGDGNSTAEPTLDQCNGRFASERLRTARLQVVETGANGNGVFSTEAVLYRDPAATGQAFRELRSVVAACPRSPVVSPVNEPTATTTYHARPDAAWPQTPGVGRLAYSFDTTANGQTSSTIAVYLRRGRALLGLYFSDPRGAQPAVAGKTTIEGIVGVFAARLAALPASVVDARR